MLLTLGSLAVAALRDLGYSLLDWNNSPLLPLLGTATFISVSGYLWSKQQNRLRLLETPLAYCKSRSGRRKTLLLTPVSLAEITPDERKRNIILLGLSGAGKTAFLQKLLHTSLSRAYDDPEPTEGVKMTSVDMYGLKHIYYEVGGADNTRMFAGEFVHMANLVIFVVDSTASAESHLESRKFFHLITTETEYKGPIVIIASKQDLPNALSVREIYDVLGVSDKDDVYILPACSAPRPFNEIDDGDHIAVEEGKPKITVDLASRHHRGIIENLLYRTFVV